MTSKKRPAVRRRPSLRVKSPRQSFKLLKALLEAGQLLNSSLDLKRVLSILLDLATKNLRAERGTIYLLDSERRELWSQVLIGEQTLEIRLPLGQGIAGFVGKTGRTLNIKDAYQDRRFDPEVDRQSGYKTRTLLCAPMKNKRGETIGVFQLLNKRKTHFDKRDERFLAALSLPASLAIENARLHLAEIEQKRIEKELEVAGDIQRQLLPKSLPSLRDLDLSACSIPCYCVGGDFYDVLKINENTIALVIADVAGKGIPAALLVSTLQAALHAYLEAGFSSAELVSKLNKVIGEDATEDKFITFLICVYDENARSLRYVNAGHNMPLLLGADARLEELHKNGPCLGIVPDSRYEEGEVQLRSGDTLILYTDGLTDAVNKKLEIFGLERFRSILARACGQDAKALQEQILREIRLFTQGQPQADDITLVIMRAAF